MRKQILSLLLTVCMVLLLLPLSAGAADIVDSGECGGSVTWTLDSDGVVTISGTGETYNYGWDGSGSPFQANPAVKSVVIKEGVTRLGDGLFTGCPNLTSVTLPEGLTQLGSQSFSNCTALTDVTFPDSLTYLRFAFQGCTGLKHVTLHKGMITEETFLGCTGLEDVTFLDGCRSVGRSAFEGCTGLTVLTFPDTMDLVGEAAFKDCTSLTEARGLETATLGPSCFEGCTQLRRIIARNAGPEKTFYNCTSLEKAEIYSMEEIGEYLFGNCTSLKEVYLSDELETVRQNAFNGANALTDVYYGEREFSWNRVQISETGNEPLLRAKLHLEQNVIANCPFRDVDITEYFYKPVMWALRHHPQITTGATEYLFLPNRTCTRGQVVTFLWRAMGCPEPKSLANPFTDVAPDVYYYKAVLWANEQNITNGMGGGLFAPESPCTRAHVVTFLWRAENQPEAGGANPFVDVAAGEYYTQAVLWAVNHQPQITNGTDETHFSPASPCTRGQIVTFLYRDMRLR